MPSRPRLLRASVEALEDRSLPATFGIPWADPGHLTLSFAPDNTPTPTGPSRLYSTLNAAASTPVWQREILRAYQTWAANTNIDVGLVSDAGHALGTSGAVQGDHRFADFRIAATHNDGCGYPNCAGARADVIAAASPFSWTGTTFSGDVLFNTGNSFAVGNKAGTYDIFSVALHEAGHALGVDHSTDPKSAVFENYAYKTGLTAGDTAAVRALYGARAKDAHDAAAKGNTLATAVPVSQYQNSPSRFVAEGDVTAAGDVDYYKFTVPAGLSLTGISVQLKAAGRSLLTGKLTVYNAAGQVVGSKSATDPLNNDAAVGIGATLLGGTYYAKVEAAKADVFGVGGYQLVVDLLAPGAVLPALAPLSAPVGGVVNDTVFGTVTTLLSTQSGTPDARFDYSHSGVLTAAVTDTYKIRAPQPATGGPVNLNVLAWGKDANPIDPRVRVFDAARRPVAFQVLSHTDGVMSVQVRDAAPGADYFVQVSAQSSGAAAGRYHFAADFNQFAPTELTGVGGDTLNPGATDSARLTVDAAGLFQFGLSSRLLQGSPGGVTMTLTDAAGMTVLTMTATGNQLPGTEVRYLAAGAYTVRYTFAAPSGGGAAGAVRYDLFMLKMSEGIGPYSTSAASGPPASGGDGGGGYEYDGSSTSSGSADYPYYF